MRKSLLLIALCVALPGFARMPHYELAYKVTGSVAGMMPDGKVDQFIQRPVLGGSFAVEFLPTGRWLCLQQWNNASIGVGVSYLNLGNEAYLGSAIAAYGYMNQPFYNGEHFRIGLRPAVGLAAVTKTYRNTLPDGVQPYSQARGSDGQLIANWSIGSIFNAYLALDLYMDFPIQDGWDITLSGGWHHISNGSIMHPNSGYNTFGGDIGVRYHPTDPEPLRPNAKSKVPRRLYEGVKKRWAIEISATGGLKQNYYKDNIDGMQFYGAATLKAAAYWVPIAIFRLGAGVDAFYDGYYSAVNKEYAALNPDAPVTYFGKTYLRTSETKNCFRVGVSLQPEFIVGKLTAGIHVGFYVFDPVKNLEPYSTVTDPEDKNYDPNALHPGDEPFSRGLFYPYNFAEASNYQDGWLYMQFILKYHVMKHLFVQLGLKTHGVRAEFIDAGVGLAF